MFWARVYERLKYYGESEEMFEGPVTIYNASLKETSSWAKTSGPRSQCEEGLGIGD